MWYKRLAASLLACMLFLSVSLVPTAAAEVTNSDIVISRSTGRLNHSLPTGITLITQALPYVKGDTIKYDCTYTPKSASVDFGFIAPDGLFYSLNSTSGSINKSIEVSQTGQFTLAIRNNESYAVTVTGTVKY